MSVLDKLRKQFKAFEIKGYILPSTDEHQSEYTPEYAKRLNYATGFSGSNGILVLDERRALFFTDGRYLEQAKQELDSKQFEILNLSELANIYWEKYFNLETSFGIDPHLFTKNSVSRFKKLKIKHIYPNLIDIIWNDQPQAPQSNLFIYGLSHAGEALESKIARTKKALNQQKAENYLINDITTICWLLNIRASDIEYSPLLISYLLFIKDKIYLFTSLKRVSKEIKNYLNPYLVLKNRYEFEEILSQVKGKIVISDKCSLHILEILKNCKVVAQAVDICKSMQVRKNQIELEESKKIHVRDAVALCEFFSWLDISLKKELEIQELDLSRKLTELRSQQEGYISESFSSICGFKENSAIIHYNPNHGSNKIIKSTGLLLIDSGAHYFGGTTDVTRTITIGVAFQEQKLRYTQVLKGHIALAKAIFPKGICGHNLDILARQYLWKDGEDYPHSTGHGVGNALSVHEFPTIGIMGSGSKLEAGMIVSNEPGYYKAGEYGIRIENLMYVKECKQFKEFLRFRNLTLLPYCHELIIVELLTQEEKQYINLYHQEIRDKVMNLLTIDAQHWLIESTKKI